MRRSLPSSSRPVRAILLVLVALLTFSSCSSDGSGDTKQDDKAAALRRANEAYLLSIGYEKDQARCVSRATKADVEALLSGAEGAGLPQDKPEYDAFAKAVRSCIRKDTGLSTTTVPPG